MVPLFAVNSRYACSLSLCCFWFLCCTRDCRSLLAYAVHFLGGFRCPSDARSPGSSLAAHRIACLGNPHRSSSVAMSINAVGKLARRPRRNRAVPGRIPAALSGQACVPQHFRQHAHLRRGNCLRRKSGVLRSTSVDQAARSSLKCRESHLWRSGNSVIFSAVKPSSCKLGFRGES